MLGRLSTGMWDPGPASTCPRAAQQGQVWDKMPPAAFAGQPDRRATGPEPFGCRPLPLKFQRLTIRGGREGDHRLLQAEGWELHLFDLGRADPQPSGLPQVPHRLHLEAQQLGPDDVGR